MTWWQGGIAVLLGAAYLGIWVALFVAAWRADRRWAAYMREYHAWLDEEIQRLREPR